jgi:hypothetical protein
MRLKQLSGAWAVAMLIFSGIVQANSVEENILCPKTESVIAKKNYYSVYSPQQAYDCDLRTYWNSSSYEDSITAKFIVPVTFHGLLLTARATPATNENYTIYGSNDGSTWNQIIRVTRQVETEPGGTLEPIVFSQVTYRYLRIDVNGGKSWVALNEVKLLQGLKKSHKGTAETKSPG